jgi:hypothetical protein
MKLSNFVYYANIILISVTSVASAALIACPGIGEDPLEVTSTYSFLCH